MRDDRITIDTNVFQHLFNPEVNTERHIDDLLRDWMRERRGLCRDSGGRIFQEYRHILEPIIRSRSDDGSRLTLLRYWLAQAQAIEVDLDQGGELMSCVKKCLRRSRAESSDQVLAGVAIEADSNLVSNDKGHLIKNREKLAQCARRHGRKNFRTETSAESARRNP